MSIRLSVLAIAAMLFSACGGSRGYTTPTNPRPSPSPSGGSSVSIVSGARTTTAYNPNPLTVSVGTTVTWMNNDGRQCGLLYYFSTTNVDSGMTTVEKRIADITHSPNAPCWRARS